MVINHRHLHLRKLIRSGVITARLGLMCLTVMEVVVLVHPNPLVNLRLLGLVTKLLELLGDPVRDIGQLLQANMAHAILHQEVLVRGHGL